MDYFVRSDGPQFQEVLCQTQEQAEDTRDKLKVEFPNQEFTVVPSGKTASREIEKTAVPSEDGYGYGFNRARASGLRPVARGSRGLKPGSRGGVSTGGGKRKKKRGKK